MDHNRKATGEVWHILAILGKSTSQSQAKLRPIDLQTLMASLKGHHAVSEKYHEASQHQASMLSTSRTHVCDDCIVETSLAS